MPNSFQHRSHRKRPIVPEQPCVYILPSDRLGALSIGVTARLITPLHQHRTSTTPGFTARYGVHRLMRQELFEMPAAIARERQLKRWRRAWKIALIEQANPQWVDLAVALGLEPVADRPRRDGC